jgi:TM2 domain-containing membrane protein YozV
MKGKVLGFDEASGDGVISGDNGNRYSFNRTEWKLDKTPSVGCSVDFIAADSRATEIFVDISAFSAGGSSGEKSKVVACLLAFFLGGLGFHKFYLGKTTAGIIMLVVFLFGFILLGIPSYIIAIIAFVEAIIYLTKSDADFDKDYVRGNKSWF